MTRTSATRRSKGARPQVGFTLLEIVVVLALLGLATALVAPAGLRTIEAWRRSTDVDAILSGLSGIGAHARQVGRALHLESGDDLTGVVTLPEGWRIELDAPLSVQANGACAPGSGRLLADGYMQGFEIQTPFCRATRTGQAPR